MEKIKGVFGILIVLVYFGIGVYCLTVDKDSVNSYPLIRIFGIAAIAYGVFRATRVYKQFKSDDHEDISNF
jgi:hypothetical protein